MSLTVSGNARRREPSRRLSWADRQRAEARALIRQFRPLRLQRDPARRAVGKALLGLLALEVAYPVPRETSTESFKRLTPTDHAWLDKHAERGRELDRAVQQWLAWRRVTRKVDRAGRAWRRCTRRSDF